MLAAGALGRARAGTTSGIRAPVPHSRLHPQTRPPRARSSSLSSPIDFKLDSSETPERHAPETMAGGVAVFDYNNDGKLDIFFSNGADIKTLHKTSAGPQRQADELLLPRQGWRQV